MCSQSPDGTLGCPCCPLCLAFFFSPCHLVGPTHFPSPLSISSLLLPGWSRCLSWHLSVVPGTALVLRATCLCWLLHLTASFLTTTFCFLVSVGFSVSSMVCHTQQVLMQMVERTNRSVSLKLAPLCLIPSHSWRLLSFPLGTLGASRAGIPVLGWGSISTVRAALHSPPFPVCKGTKSHKKTLPIICAIRAP